MNLINVAWTKEVEARSRHNGDKKEWAAEIRELKTGRGARARARHRSTTTTVYDSYNRT